MDPTSSPFELISYRGLLKSFDDIKRGNFMLPKNTKPENDKDSKTNTFLFIGTNKTKMLNSIRNSLVFSIFTLINYVERFLYFLMSGYDDYVYSPMQKYLSPICKKVPRYISLNSNRKIPIFTANLITLGRTFLVIPIAWFLKYDYNLAAFFCVVFHDFLDHLDGIVAKVQRITYPNHDDPLLGGFLDAFCDKIVNVLSIWTILQTASFDNATQQEKCIFLAICYSVISYETIIGIVRVEDYFRAQFKRRYNIEDKSKPNQVDDSKATAASMEGKLKEKLESTGIACLCMSVSKLNENPINNNWGIAGLVCLLLTLRMAHKSLSLKLKMRTKTAKKSTTESKEEESAVYINKCNSTSADNLLHLINGPLKNSSESMESNFLNTEMKMINIDDNAENNLNYKKPRNLLYKSENKDSLEKDGRVDKVYTIGCFDLFHQGHIKLLTRMRQYGRKVIVGVHDSRSIYKLKNRVPIDSTEKRMLNVKSYADVVFCVAGCDPTSFISSIVSLNPDETALYIRGNDMENFPSKDIVEKLMPIKFLPYTEGVSSTQLRKENFNHVEANDEDYLEKNN